MNFEESETEWRFRFAGGLMLELFLLDDGVPVAFWFLNGGLLMAAEIVKA